MRRALKILAAPADPLQVRESVVSCIVSCPGMLSAAPPAAASAPSPHLHHPQYVSK